MKLLLDQNLAPRLVVSLADLFPGSRHVQDAGLGEAADTAVWEFAKAEGLVLVTKDSDFVDRGTVLGPPPKVIAILLGNCSTAQVESLLRMRSATIEAFNLEAAEAVLLLP